MPRPFEFAALQMGLLLNSSIYGGGMLTVSYSNVGSGLDLDQQFAGSADIVGSLSGYPGQISNQACGEQHTSRASGCRIRYNHFLSRKRYVSGSFYDYKFS